MPLCPSLKGRAEVQRLCPVLLPRPSMVMLDGPDPALTPAALCSLLTSNRPCTAVCRDGAAAAPALPGRADPLSPGVLRSFLPIPGLGAVGHRSL